MSFSFGPTTTTTGGTFGTTTPSTGFTFGGGDTKTLFGGSGAAQGENKGAFNFTSPTSNAPAFGGFSFGSKTTTAAPSMFSTPSTTTTSPFGASKPLSFGGLQSPPNQTVGSPGFGQPAGQTAAQNLSFGAPSTQPPAFGTPTTQASSTPTFGSPAAPTFGSTPATTAGAGAFSFSTPATGFSAAPSQPAAAPQTSQPSFGLKPAAPATSAPAFGQTSAFGKPASGFGFGQTAASTAAPAFGTTSSTFGQPQTQQNATTQPPLSFGTLPAVSLAPAGTSSAGALGAASTLATSGTTGTTGTLGTTGGLGALGTGSGFNFGGTTAAATQPGGLNFGAGFGTTQQSTPATQAQPPKLGFGAPTSSAAPISLAATPAQPAAGLGATVASTQPTAISFAANTQPSGIKFGATTTAAATSASTGLAFGTSLSSAVSSAPSLASTAAPTGLSFSAASTAATTSAAPGISLLGKSTATTTLPSLTTAVTTTASGPPQPIASVTFSQLEENINKWTIELEEQEKTFINQATQINAWDRLLIANGEKIVELNDAVETVKNEQQNLEHELDFVLGQQKELEELLAPMEAAVQGGGDRPRDPHRDHMYSLAENLDTQLRQMSEDLKEVIEHLNETNRSQDSNDPIVQIGRILNAHMSSMQWIDNSIAQISTKLDQLKATHDTLRRDNERSFQLTYN